MLDCANLWVGDGDRSSKLLPPSVSALLQLLTTALHKVSPPPSLPPPRLVHQVLSFRDHSQRKILKFGIFSTGCCTARTPSAALPTTHHPPLSVPREALGSARSLRDFGDALWRKRCES